MRRIFLLFLLLLGGWVMVTAVYAQINSADDTETPPFTWKQLPPADQSILLEEVQPERGLPQNVVYLPMGDTMPANDSCNAATNVVFAGTAVGGTTTVSGMSQAVDDPELSCMWGTPQSPKGFRTVWYKFSAVQNGVVTIDTVTSNYDTVVGVYTGVCGSLNPVACNDDFSGFSSRVTFNIKQGQTYYVEIADWNAGGSGQKVLNAFIQSEPIDSQWDLLPNQSPGRTGAAAATYSNAIYQFGGQDASGNISDDIYRFNTANNTWTLLGGSIPRRYFSATRANNKIYLPGGDTSSDNVSEAITDKHSVYDPSVPSLLPLALLPTPVAWAQSVAIPGQNYYYLIGGLGEKWDAYPTVTLTTTTTAYNTVWKYNIGGNNWTTEATTMLTPRFGHTAAYVGGKICVMGGLNEDLEMLVSGECWTPGGASSFIPSTNIPRYGAGSAVAPDGRWFIFGGLDSTQTPVSEVEVWNPNSANPSWAVLDVSFDLGGTVLDPPRARPQGAFVGYNLYAFGGSLFDGNAGDTIGVNFNVERLYSVGGNYNYLPVMLNGKDTTLDNNFSVARPIAVNTTQNGRFYESTDFYSAYTFQVNNFGIYTVRLNGIPSSSDYNLYLYDSNKDLLGDSENGGNLNESIPIALLPGQYYVMIERIYGSSGGSSGFQISVTQ